MGFTGKEHEILVKIAKDFKNGRLRTPIFLKNFANGVANGGRNNKIFKNVRKYLLENKLIEEEEADFCRKRITFINLKRLSQVIRESEYFKLHGEFIEAFVLGHNY